MGASVQATRAKYGQTYYDRYALGASSNNAEVKGMIEVKKGQRVKLSTNFISKEFDCQGSGCCSTTFIDKKLVEYLQKIRDHFKKPVTITSAYRCQEHNKRVGGATGSYHAKGQAADITITGVAPLKIAQYAESIGIKGIGLYETPEDGNFVHIDTRTYKSFWYGKKEQPRTTFGGAQEGKETYHKNQTKYSLKLFYLQPGDYGQDVRILQSLLIAHGYKVSITGKYDEQTYQAVIAFQKKKQLAPDGVVGSKTMEKLLGY